jgi:AraC-like DNA-binding protein
MTVQDEWTAAVSRTIATMREQIDEPHELQDIARREFMSPFHFHRVFQMVTSSTPGRFLTALRIAKAKQLLLETSMTSTDVSIAVGYSSFGTFTTQFTKLVGMPPGRFRSSVVPISDVPVQLLLEQMAAMPGPTRRTVCATVGPRPDRLTAYAIVGAFSSVIPQHRPSECVVGRTPGTVCFTRPLHGRSLLAVSAHPAATVRDILTERPAAALCIGIANADLHIPLRPHLPTDPPVVVGFPLLGQGGRW